MPTAMWTRLRLSDPEDREVIAAAGRLLMSQGYDLRTICLPLAGFPGAPLVVGFETQWRTGEVRYWDAELGAADLAFLVAMILDIPNSWPVPPRTLKGATGWRLR